jgi:hypothetical protein
MKDKKPRASYRRGRGVAMSPRGRSTAAPRPRISGGMPQAPKVALKSTMNVGRPQAPTLPVRGGMPKAPKVTLKPPMNTVKSQGPGSLPKPVQSGRPPAPTLKQVRGGRPQAPTFPVRDTRAKTTMPVQNSRPTSPVVTPSRGRRPASTMMPTRGGRQMFAKGGKAGYGSVQEMEKACMVKSDHNPSMRQK